MTEAGHVLKPGELVRHDGLLFQVERVERRRVMRVKLEILDTAGNEQQVNTANSASRG